MFTHLFDNALMDVGFLDCKFLTPPPLGLSIGFLHKHTALQIRQLVSLKSKKEETTSRSLPRFIAQHFLFNYYPTAPTQIYKRYWVLKHIDKPYVVMVGRNSP